MAEKGFKHFDVVVIGAGPAGLAAAHSAANAGAKVGMLDDNQTVGGQIWRGDLITERSQAGNWVEKLKCGGVDVLCGAAVIHQNFKSGLLFAETHDGLIEIQFSKVVLATGARERLLPFPDWTLPNVMGAGGLQAMVKCGLPIAGKRVVVAGTGPLLLAVAAYLRKRGAEVLAICEQASWRTLARFAAGLVRYPVKLREAITLRGILSGVPFWPETWPIRALGREKVEAVVVCRNGRSRELACDYLACGFHLVPNTELAVLIGSQLEGNCVKVDEQQQTSIPGVFCAGEPTGIAGLEVSLIEGQIAGLAAAGAGSRSLALRRQRRKWQPFVRSLEKAFSLRPELRVLADTSTIVCRCEDVPYARIARYTSWRDAKNQSRCGMGPCQGRICGPALESLFGWHRESVRPPIFPARLDTLAAIAGPHDTGA